MTTFKITVFAVFSVLLFNCNIKSDNSLSISSENPRYFTDSSGEAVYLTGSHTWNNLVEMSGDTRIDTFDYQAYLKFLKSYNHNFIRLWAWDLLTWNTQGNREENSKIVEIFPKPWLRTGPGVATDRKPKFDLTKFNQDYFDRLRRRVIAAGDNDIYVSVMLFEGWGLQFSPNGFKNHPFHPLNNVNAIEIDTAGDANGFEIYELSNDKITRLQEAYVKKVIETVGDLDNVLYEISNENHLSSTEWQYHIIRYIKEVEAHTGKQHPVGMTFQYKGGSNKDLFESPADWISPNPEGGYNNNPPENDGSKVIITDTDHLWGIGGNRKWVWKSFMRGLNTIFMDPYDGKVLERGSGETWAEEVRVALGYTRQFADKMDLIKSVTAGNIVSSEYCLAVPGKEYLVYIPDGNKVEIDLSSAEGNYKVEWFNTLNGEVRQAEDIRGNQKTELISPFENDEVAVYLKRK